MARGIWQFWGKGGVVECALGWEVLGENWEMEHYGEAGWRNWGDGEDIRPVAGDVEIVRGDNQRLEAIVLGVATIVRELDEIEERKMDSIAQSAVAGLIAALAATGILGLAKYFYHRWATQQNVGHIRNILIQGRARVMGAKDTFHQGMNVMMSADVLRAAQYNYMIREVSVALDRWAMNLSHEQRKDLYNALDWYHRDGLYATKRDGKVVFMELPEGRWPTAEMSMQDARRKFDQLRSVKWLKLEAD